MEVFMYRKACGFMILAMGIILLFSQTLFGQSLKDDIDGIFKAVLELRTGGPAGTQHGQHFIPNNVAFSKATINAFSNFVATNVSSFPLSSTAAGLTFDFSTGVPVSTSTSLGPIFAERAQTLGKGRFNLGFNYSYLNLNKLRGINTEDVRFTFTHQDVGDPGLGDSDNEFDTIDLFMNMDLSASILAFIATFGVTNQLDIGVAIPFVNIKMKAEPLAVVNSFTIAKLGSPNHFFVNNGDTSLSTRPDPVDDDATGVGDIAIRAKYNFLREKSVNFAALLEYRAPTGDEKNFLGTGKSSLKTVLISSANIGNFNPHLNLAYNYRTSDLERDEIQAYVGFDQKVSETLTLAIDVLSEFEIGSQIEALKFPEPVVVQRDIDNILVRKEVSVTNIPRFSNDNSINAAWGFKFHPKKSLMIIGNVFAPLNDGGLRSSWTPTFGFEFSF